MAETTSKLEIVTPTGHLADAAAQLPEIVAKAAAGDRHADKQLCFVERYGARGAQVTERDRSVNRYTLWHTSGEVLTLRNLTHFNGRDLDAPLYWRAASSAVAFAQNYAERENCTITVRYGRESDHEEEPGRRFHCWVRNDRSVKFD